MLICWTTCHFIQVLRTSRRANGASVLGSWVWGSLRLDLGWLVVGWLVCWLVGWLLIWLVRCSRLLVGGSVLGPRIAPIYDTYSIYSQHHYCWVLVLIASHQLILLLHLLTHTSQHYNITTTSPRRNVITSSFYHNLSSPTP